MNLIFNLLSKKIVSNFSVHIQTKVALNGFMKTLKKWITKSILETK